MPSARSLKVLTLVLTLCVSTSTGQRPPSARPLFANSDLLSLFTAYIPQSPPSTAPPTVEPTQKPTVEVAATRAAEGPAYDPCLADPCASLQDPANLCISDWGASSWVYVCVCNGQAWRPTVDSSACLPPARAIVMTPTREPTPVPTALPTPAPSSRPTVRATPEPTRKQTVCDLVGDPCFSQLEPLNACEALPGGTYTCRCRAQGWSTPFLSLTCSPPQPRGRSRRTCSEVAASPNTFGVVMPTGAHGSDAVCGISEVVLESTNPRGKQCPQPMTFVDALRLCSSVGARLCSAGELARGEARGSGCALDDVRVWSNSVEGCPAGQAGTQAGAGVGMQALCASLAVVNHVRCCLDEPTLSPTEAPTLQPTQYPTPFPTTREPTPAPPAQCNNGECGSALNAGNQCVDHNDGTYHCECALGWKREATTTVAEMCVAGPCFRKLLDPCRAQEGVGNVCLPGMGDAFSCVCGDEWLPSVSGKSCEPRPNPCLTTPACATAIYPANLCLDMRDGTYRCDCGPGWTTAADKLSCKPPVNECKDPSDPCRVLAQQGNRCAPNPDGSYQCLCTVGWTFLAGDALSAGGRCVAPNNPCKADPCSSAADPVNLCLPTIGGDFTCECYAQGWLQGAKNRSCLAPPEPCRDAARCGTDRHLDNRCVPIPGPGGEYACVCGAPGWATPTHAQNCTAPIDPCLGTADPCETKGSKNKCFNQFDGTYSCKCVGDYLVGAGAQNCRLPTHPCTLGDPCSSVLNTDNFCQRAGKDQYECLCAGKGWTVTTDGQACRAPVDPCIEHGHKCGGAESPFNACVDRRDGTYVCSCRAQAWTLAPDADACLCPNPCTATDPCGSVYSDQNSCTASTAAPGACASHTCSCGDDWDVAEVAGKAVCRRRDPCEDGSDPCRTREGKNNNRCVALTDSATGFINSREPYQCSCEMPTFVSPPGGRSCERVDPCAVGDPCATRFGPANGCTARAPDAEASAPPLSCSCGQPGFALHPDGMACVPCRNPCPQLDPCKVSKHPSNQCVWQFDSAPWPTYEAMLQQGLMSTETRSHGGKALVNTVEFTSIEMLLEDSGLGEVQAGDLPDRAYDDYSSAGYDPDAYYDPDNYDWDDYSYDDSKDIDGMEEGISEEIKEEAVVTEEEMSGEDSISGLTDPAQTLDFLDAFDLFGDLADSTLPVAKTSAPRTAPPTVAKPTSAKPTRKPTSRPTAFWLSPTPDPTKRSTPTQKPTTQPTKRATGQPSRRPTAFPTALQPTGSWVPPVCGAVKCECGDGWQPAQQQTTCELKPCMDPCASDPCQSGRNPSNQCVRVPLGFGVKAPIVGGMEVCALHRCECEGPEWTKGASQGSCILCDLAPCALSPCGENSLNVCLPSPDTCGEFQCACGAPGALASADGRRCEVCPAPCAGDPCRVGEKAGNTCSPIGIASSCQQHVCTCAGDFRLTEKGDACERRTPVCADPCAAIVDPCNMRTGRGNSCLRIPPSVGSPCGRPQCTCDERAGWVSAFGGQSCSAPRSGMAASAAVTTESAVTLPPTPFEAAMTYAMLRDGSIECRDPCMAANPCMSHMDSANQCRLHRSTTARRAVTVASCGAYSCTCKGDGWTTRYGGQGCVRVQTPNAVTPSVVTPSIQVTPVSYCRNDECSTSASAGNVCMADPTTNNYVCYCDQRGGWRAPFGGRSCVLDRLAVAPGREVLPEMAANDFPTYCQGHDSCRTVDSPGNTCFSSASRQAYRCDCKQQGFKTSPDYQSCVPG